MESINWRRVLAGGTLAGIVLIALTITSLLFINRTHQHFEMQPSMRALGTLLFALFVFLFAGTLMTFWYAAMRPRFGPGPKTAAVAGLLVWLIAVAEMLKAVAMYQPANLPPGPALPLLYLGIIVLSTEAGAWLYKEA